MTHLVGNGYVDETLSETEAKALIQEAFASHNFSGKRILVIIPDSTPSSKITSLTHSLIIFFSSDFFIVFLFPLYTECQAL